MKTCAQILAEVRFNAGKLNDTVNYTDARLLSILNHAVREIYKIVFISNPANCPLCKITTINLVSGQESYSLPSDIFAISSIADIRLVSADGNYNSRPLRRLPVADRARDYGYVIINKKLYLSPMSDASNFSKIMITYLPSPDDLLLTDEPDLPDACEEYIIDYMERRIQKNDSSSDLSVSISFTEEQKNMLIGIFGDVSQDALYPPITDDTYMSF